MTPRRRLAMAALACLLTAGALFASSGGRGEAWTHAAWTDAERTTATVSAASLTAPSGATCVPTSVALLGLQSVRLTWSSPQQGGQRVEITRGTTTGSDSTQIVQTGTSGGLYTYSATYTTAKLLELVNLTDLLGGTYTIRIFSGYPGSAWSSPPRTFTLTVVLLGLNSTCTAV